MRYRQMYYNKRSNSTAHDGSHLLPKYFNQRIFPRNRRHSNSLLGLRVPRSPPAGRWKCSGGGERHLFCVSHRGPAVVPLICAAELWRRMWFRRSHTQLHLWCSRTAWHTCQRKRPTRHNLLGSITQRKRNDSHQHWRGSMLVRSHAEWESCREVSANFVPGCRDGSHRRHWQSLVLRLNGLSSG